MHADLKTWRLLANSATDGVNDTPEIYVEYAIFAASETCIECRTKLERNEIELRIGEWLESYGRGLLIVKCLWLSGRRSE